MATRQANPDYNSSNPSIVNSLAEYVQNCYRQWGNDRKANCELDWLNAWDAFRGKYSDSTLKKWKKTEGQDWRSQTFIRVTRRKVIAFLSQFRGIYFQGDNIPFHLLPAESDDFSPMGGNAEQNAQKMKASIDDQLGKVNAKKRYSSGMLDIALYGMGFMKAPVIKERTTSGFAATVPQLPFYMPPEAMAQFAQYMMVHGKEKLLHIENPSCWDMFWDMYGEDFNTNQGVIQRSMMTTGDLYRLYQSNPERYDLAAIKRVAAKYESVSNQSQDTMSEGGKRKDFIFQNIRNVIPVLEFVGYVPASKLKDTQLGKSVKDDPGLEVEVIVTVVDHEIIAQPLEYYNPAGTRPWHVTFYEPLPHMLLGNGIADNLQDVQQMLNGAMRLSIDNKALSGNGIFVKKANAFKGSQSNALWPGRVFEADPSVVDVNSIFRGIALPDVGATLLDMISLFDRYADEESGLPKALEGQNSGSQPKTAFAFSRLIEAANKQIGNVIKNTDEGWTEPIITNYYFWAMLTHPDETIKGNFESKATGYSGYNDKITRGDNLRNLLEMIVNNQFLMQTQPNLLNMVRDVARSADIDPDRYFPTDAELEQQAIMMQAQQAQMQQQAALGGMQQQGADPTQMPPDMAGGMPQ